MNPCPGCISGSRAAALILLAGTLCLSLNACTLISIQPPPVVVTQNVVTVQPVVVTVEVPVTVTPAPTPIASATPPQPAYSGSWVLAAVMSVARGQHTATVLNDGRVLFAGGYRGPDGDTASAEIFDPATGTFRPTGALNTARHGASATRLSDGRVLVVAGYHDTWLTDAEVYDPATGLWSISHPLYAHGVGHVALLLADGRVLVLGGAIRSGPSGPDDRVELFDPVRFTWTAAAPHAGIDAGASAVLLQDGRALIAGGSGDPALYDPAANAWQPAGKLAVPRSQAQAVRLLDGRVLLIGGVNGESVLNSVEVYDPATNVWSSAAPLDTPRYFHTATLLPDGRVLVVGGWDVLNGYAAALLASTEIFDPASGTWTPGPTLATGRVSHTTSLLPDGRLLVAGGQVGYGEFLDSTELLLP